MQRSSNVRRIKIIHRYLGLFFAPAIIFFSLSGALQTLGLHNTAPGSGNLPARWIVLMAQIHKKQTLAVPVPKTKSLANASDNSHSGSPAKRNMPAGKRALQLFVVLMSGALMGTTLLGIVMASMYGGDRRLTALILIAGILFPISVMLL